MKVFYILLSFINNSRGLIWLVGSFNVSDDSLPMQLPEALTYDCLIAISDNKTDTDFILSSMSSIGHRPVTLIQEHKLMPTISLIMEKLSQRESIKELKSHLNFAVIGKSDLFYSIMQKADILDTTYGVKSVLRHFSKWIWFPTYREIIELQKVTTDLDNVAVIQKDRNGTVITDTLLWTPNGREWSRCCMQVDKPESSDVFPNMNRGLNGRTLTVAVLEFIPHSKRNIIDGEIVYKGSSHEILSQISNKLNFSIRYVEPVDKQWGQLSNGSWDGIIEMLNIGEADLCSVPYAMNIERSKVMTFTFPTANVYHSAVYRKSEDESRHWKVLVSCFRWEVYLCGFVVICVVVVVLELSHRMTEDYQAFTVFDAMTLGIAIPLRQGGLSRESPLTSYRILLSFWWLFCIIMTSVYTGNLIALLTVSREYVPFKTLEEIGEQNRFTVSLAPGSYMELLLKTTQAPELKKIWEKTIQIKDPGSFIGNEYLKGLLFKEHTVLIMDEPSIDVLMSNTCGLTKLSKSFMPVYAAMPFPKFSPLAELFASELMALTEGGLIPNWYDEWTPPQKQCDPNRGKFQLKLRDLLSAFVGLAVGVFVSSIVLCCEYALWKK